jgi:hypothetical protein
MVCFRSVGLPKLTFLSPALTVLRTKPVGSIECGALEESRSRSLFEPISHRTEAGVTVYPHPRFGISTGYRYRMMWFDSASGVSHSSANLRPRFHETTGSMVITGLFTF